MEHHTKPILCPACGMQLDGATEVLGDGEPHSGDLGLCTYCGVFLVFGAEQEVYLASPEYLEEVRVKAPKAYRALLSAKVSYESLDKSILQLFTVYRYPSDYPDKYVLRRWDIGRNGSRATSWVRTADMLEEIRSFVPYGLCRMMRNPEDDPCIEETWI
jgi:hypothetical protein